MDKFLARYAFATYGTVHVVGHATPQPTYGLALVIVQGLIAADLAKLPTHIVNDVAFSLRVIVERCD